MTDYRKWKAPDEDVFTARLVDYYTSQMSRYIRKMLIILLLETVFPLVLIASCIFATKGSTGVLLPMTIACFSTGAFFIALFGVMMYSRVKAIKGRHFSWNYGEVDKGYQGRRGKVYVNVDGKIEGCVPFTSFKKFQDGDTVFVIKALGYFPMSVFAFPIREE